MGTGAWELGSLGAWSGSLPGGGRSRAPGQLPLGPLKKLWHLGQVCQALREEVSKKREVLQKKAGRIRETSEPVKKSAQEQEGESLRQRLKKLAMAGRSCHSLLIMVTVEGLIEHDVWLLILIG